MASTRKSTQRTGAQRWQAVWNEPGPSGTTRQRTKNFARQSEARTYANQMEREVERRGVGDWEKHSVERYLKRWLATLEARNEHSPTTLASYRRNAGLACRYIGHIALERLSPAHLDGLYATLLQSGGVARTGKGHGERSARPLNPRTVLHVHRTLHRAFKQAKRWKMISENPAADATAPTPRKSPVRAFSEDEVARLLAAAARDRETYCMLAVLLVGGVRRSELVGLAWDAVDLEKGSIAVKRVVLEVEHVAILREIPKSESSERSISIPPLLIELLREQKKHCLEAALAWGGAYRKSPMFVFARPDGEHCDPMGITYRLRQVMRRAKVTGRAPTHGWRHTCATALLGAVDIATVSGRLGHANPSVTLKIYSHRTEQRDQAAGEHLATLLKPLAKP